MTSFDIAEWLKSQWIYPKVYWESKKKQEVHAAYGSIASAADLPKHPNMSFFGSTGFSQMKKEDPLWSAFPYPYFFSPAFERKQSLADTPRRTVLPSPAAIKRIDFPTKPEWLTKAAECLNRIRKDHLQKVVLARRTTFLFSGPLDPYHALACLRARSNTATLFLFQPSLDTAFIGATPEHLFGRKERTLFSEAVAGTRPLGKSDAEMAQMKQELLTSDKEMREFLFVKDGIQSILAPHCTSMHWEKDVQVLTTASAHHLHSILNATLHDKTDDHLLLKSLHPTPAMGGFPKDAALELIAELEPFERGLYAAPLGWSSESQAEFAVGIRSALIRGNELHLFAGAGIVEGSEPEKEWEELEHKIALYKGLYE